jgi:hypothetical protein
MHCTPQTLQLRPDQSLGRRYGIAFESQSQAAGGRQVRDEVNC